MTALCVRGLAARRVFWRLSAALLSVFLASQAIAAETIAVELDQATILKLPDRATTVVIGNPLIADLSIQAGGLAIVTGKAFGETNVVATDKSGAVLLEKTVEVVGPADPIVVIYRGISRETYSCTPLCSPRITLGDDPEYFNKIINESSTRNTQALAAGAGVH